MSCRVKTVYNAVNNHVNRHNQSVRWALLHHRILPNYLISFNFRVHYNLLPVKSKFANFQLDNNSRCVYCNLHYETITHILCKCVKLNILWDFFDELMAILNIDYTFSHKRTVVCEYEVMNIKCGRDDIKIILYLNSIINYHLWKARNRSVYEGVSFDFNDIVGRLIKSVAARKRLQVLVLDENLKVNRLDEILSTMTLLHNISSSHGNG